MNSEHVLNTTNLIDSETQKKIDVFVKNISSPINNILEFLSTQFSIDITLDKDIIRGYDHDW